MLSNLGGKIRESAVSVIPIMGIVILLHLFLAPLPEGGLSRFLVGGVLIIAGLSVFLTGADLGMVAFGQRVGGALTRRRNLPLILASSFIIGFAITIAEPDVQVLALQVVGIAPEINRALLLLMIASGVGLFLVVAMFRVIVQLPLRLLLIGFYFLVFGMSACIDPGFVGVAFDSGGATTGPITVPFIMAMGIGVASSITHRKGDDNSFGFVGLASIGPILAVAMMGLVSRVHLEAAPVESQASGDKKLAGLLDTFLSLLPHAFLDIALALAPLFVLFVVFQFVFLRLPFEQVRRMVLGFIYSFFGLVMFMTGVEGGFTPAGRALGIGLGGMADGWLLLPIGFLLGAMVVCAEPAVWVLAEQVESVSGGHIPRRHLLAALSISIAVAVTLGMFRVTTGVSIWWMLIPGYALALGLTAVTPPLFTAIAFDSGGVASGPMSTTFVLALTLGASVAVGGNPVTDAFGMVAMIAMAPLVTIQAFGMVVRRIERDRVARRQTRIIEKSGAGEERL
ncbi:MAG: DUF1538 domain-containing protein [Planctomycetota bacterium]|nr:DUF1538 domain-containing protein [Planctomycetota bacterium]